jgi:hypothetical protein
MGPSSQPVLRTDFKTLAINQFHAEHHSQINQLMQSSDALGAKGSWSFRSGGICRAVGGVEIGSDIILYTREMSQHRALGAGERTSRIICLSCALLHILKNFM